MKPLHIQKFPFKNVLFFNHRVQNICSSSVFRNLAALVGSKQAKRSDLPCRTRLNSSKDNLIAKRFRLSTKRKLSIFFNFLFPFVSFIGIFSILKCKTLVLKTTTWWTRASHFFDGWYLLGCQIRFYPHPLNGWHDHWTFVGEDGIGDLVWVRIF